MTSTSGQREIVVCRDGAELAAEAAKRIVAASQSAIEQRGIFTLVLSGGSTPEKTYSLLAQPEWVGRVDWSHTWFFFGDERMVPPADLNSNYRMAARALLEAAHIDPKHVLRIGTDAATPAECAKTYESQLRAFFAGHGVTGLPQFDMILLGLGNDGHSASLFPGMPALKETASWVTWSRPGMLPPPVDRITLTFPVLNAASEVMFLVSGGGKATIVHKILEGEAAGDKYPAARVRPASGKLVWMLDEAAGNLLKN